MNFLALDGRLVRELNPEARALLERTLLRVAEEIPDVAQQFCRRALAPGCRIARVVELDGDLSPTLELLLHELRAVAEAPGLPEAVRLRRALDALELAGFYERVEE